MERDPFKEYLKESEPNKKNKTYAWKTAIGLQEVDGLKPSEYLIETAAKNIEGKITFAEAKDLIDSYYRERPVESTDEKMWRRLIKYLCASQRSCPKRDFHLHRMNIYPFIESCFMIFIPMRG